MPPKSVRWLWWATLIAVLLPALHLVFGWVRGAFGAVPEDALLHLTGRYALLFLMTSLLIGPLSWIKILQPLLITRRMIGVSAFFYATIHALIWAYFDQGFALDFIFDEVRFIAQIRNGAITLLLLTPLALTSNSISFKRLGSRRWRMTHQLIWPATIFALFHANQSLGTENTIINVIIIAFIFAAFLKVISIIKIYICPKL